eukprot:1147635-Pelagomonas_calceolata.AAC.10
MIVMPMHRYSYACDHTEAVQIWSPVNETTEAVKCTHSARTESADLYRDSCECTEAVKVQTPCRCAIVRQCECIEDLASWKCAKTKTSLCAHARTHTHTHTHAHTHAHTHTHRPVGVAAEVWGLPPSAPSRPTTFAAAVAAPYGLCLDVLPPQGGASDGAGCDAEKGATPDASTAAGAAPGEGAVLGPEQDMLAEKLAAKVGAGVSVRSSRAGYRLLKRTASS